MCPAELRVVEIHAAPVIAQPQHITLRLIQQLDAYARGDYTTMHSVIYDGYQHMFHVATALSGAIGPTIAARLPKGGVQTGGGGMARSR